MVHRPFKNDFKIIIDANLIKNFLILSQDVEIAQKISGPDTRSLQGNTNRKKGPVIGKDIIKIPKRIQKLQRK